MKKAICMIATTMIVFAAATLYGSLQVRGELPQNGLSETGVIAGAVVDPNGKRVVKA